MGGGTLITRGGGKVSMKKDKRDGGSADQEAMGALWGKSGSIGLEKILFPVPQECAKRSIRKGGKTSQEEMCESFWGERRVSA